MDFSFTNSPKGDPLTPGSINPPSVGLPGGREQFGINVKDESVSGGTLNVEATGSPAPSSMSNQYQDMDLPASFTEELNDIVVDDFLQGWDDNIDSLLSGMEMHSQYLAIPVDLPDSRWIGQWNEFCQLASRTNNNAVRNQMDRYSREFTAILEFRARFADAIERKCWDLIDPINYQPGDEHTKHAKAIVYNLLEEINRFLSDVDNKMSFELSARLQQWQRELQFFFESNQYGEEARSKLTCNMERYSDQPMELVQLMVKMLKKERSIMEFAANQATSTVNQDGFLSNGNAAIGGESQLERIQCIMNKISELETQNREVTIRLDKMTSEYQQLQLCTSGNVRALSNPPNFPTREAQNNWRSVFKLRDNLIRNKQALIGQFHQERFSRQLPPLVMSIKQEIALWQRGQAYINNGKNLTDYCDIDQLEDCCKPIGQLLNASLEQIVKLRYLDLVDSPGEQQNLNALQQHYEATVKDLVENTLVVEKQPPQVLMKDKKFACQLRQLLGNGLTSHQFRFDTKVWLINTEAATAILEGGHTVEIQRSGEILNNSAKADFVDQTRQLHIHMRNMSLRMRQRGDRGRADCVAEEKFCMVFRSNISLRFPSNAECNVVAQTMSLPIVVISHGKQEADAQATIFWDNAFSENLRRRPFEVPDSVKWGVVLDELDWLWKKSCQGVAGGLQEEGRGLDEDAKRYLSLKLWGRDDRNVMVNWRQFNRDNLPGLNFTFWTWLFKIMELVSSPCVRVHWNDGRIIGFVSKADCQRMLMQRPLGTFLFRFSDSTLGAVSISCFTLGKYSGANEVGHLEPDTIAKFKARSLPDMVKDIHFLVYLYPDLPKDTAFGQYYTRIKTQDPHSAYWPKELHIVANNDGFGNNDVSSPGTPLSPNSSFSTPQVKMNVMS